MNALVISARKGGTREASQVCSLTFVTVQDATE